MCFVVGGLTLLLLRAQASSRHGGIRSLLRSCLILLAVSLLWSLLRMSLLIGLVLHMVLRADTVTYPNVGELLVSAWLHIALLGGIALLASYLVPVIPRRPLPCRGPSPATAESRDHAAVRRVAGDGDRRSRRSGGVVLL